MIRHPTRATLLRYSKLFRSGGRGAGNADERQLIAGLTQFIASLPIYRTYIDGRHSHPHREDREILERADRKSTRLNSSHANISYAVFCLKKKNNTLKLTWCP